jgi:hypothetical protein
MHDILDCFQQIIFAQKEIILILMSISTGYLPLDEQNSLLLCKFRTTNHKLPIVKGRWSNIPRENRYFELCQKNQIGDEYHYIFECTNLNEKRTSLLPKHLIERPNIIKLKHLMTSERKPILQKLCKFIRYMNMIVFPPG